MATTVDDGAILCGSTGSFGAGGDAYVLRIDQSGVIIWSRHLGGAGVEIGADVIVLGDGGCVMAGTTNSMGQGGYDGYLVALDQQGATEWEFTYGGNGWDFFHSIIEVADGMVIVGSSSSFSTNGTEEVWMVKVEPDGSEQWSITIPDVSPAVARGVVVAEEGRLAVVGTTWSSTTDTALFVLYCSSDGDLIWHEAYGGASREEGYGITYRGNGTLAAVGYTESYSDKRQMFMARMDIDGSPLGSGPISSSGNDWEAHSILTRPDGNYAIAGYTKEYGLGGKDFSLLFADESGNFISGPTYGGTMDDEAWGVDLTNDGGYYVIGASGSYGPGIGSMFVVRSDGDTLNGAVDVTLDPVGMGERMQQVEGALWPNPARAGQAIHVMSTLPGKTTFTLYDAQGRVVDAAIPVDGSFVVRNLTEGIYLVHSDHDRSMTPMRLIIVQ